MEKYKIPLLFILGLAVGLGGAYFYKQQMNKVVVSSAVHVHSDILVYIEDERLSFTDDKYQSRSEHILHPKFHFHDGNDDVIHRHDNDLTLAEFFGSLGYVLTNDCLTTDDERQFCSSLDNGKELILFVNGNKEADIENYVNQDEDQILLYYGNKDSLNLQNYLESVSDRACLYSGLCPERGTPPPEECGLTCEL